MGMKQLFLTLILLPTFLFAQTKEQRITYDSLVNKAQAAFQNRLYESASQMYLDAIKAFGDKGFNEDRYKAAQSLAQAGRMDPAFANLQRLFDKTSHLEYKTLDSDSFFIPLHADPRWQILLEALRPEIPQLAEQLYQIHHLDQDLRKTLGETRKRYGPKSPQMDSLWIKINLLDSINLLEIKQMLDAHGWLGPKQVGHRGNTTLWLVIQHADLATQEHYLPMMQAAADAGKASCGNLAYLEDRILVRKNQKQWYGSQHYKPNGSNVTLYFPVEDPDNLNDRRESMGLSPFSLELIEEIKKAGAKE